MSHGWHSRWRAGASYHWCAIGVAAIGALALVACSPALDWRETRLAAPGWSIWFPCKPKLQERSIELTGQAWNARLMACDAAGLTFAALVLAPSPASAADAAKPGPNLREKSDPARESASLQALVNGSTNRWGPLDGAQEPPLGAKLPEGVQGQWTRHRRMGPEGQAVVAQVLSFSQAGLLVQISLQGPALDASAAEPFFGQLRYAP